MSQAQALLLLAQAEGAPPGALEKALVRALPAGGQLATILPESALPALAHAAGLAPGLPEALATVEPRQAPALIAALAGVLDKRRSTLLAFRRHDVLPGRDAIRLHFALRRLARLTLEEFHDYWLNRHAQLGRRLIPPFSYHQLHADPAETANWAAQAGLAASDLDGVVEVHFPNVAALVSQLSRPEVASEALEDEKNFIDHARSEFWAYREWPVRPAPQ